MKNDFQPVVGHRFNFTADWGAVDCEVLVSEPNAKLSYRWSAYDLKSIVTWILTPTESGTLLHMQQSGFRPEQPQYYTGATHGWKKFIAAFEQVAAKI